MATVFAAVLALTAGCDKAGSGFSYAVTNDGAVITRYMGSATEVVIPRQIGGKPVIGIGPGAFSVKDPVTSQDLTSVTIPDTVTSIGEGAFVNRTRLAGITIPNSVTNIGDYAFADCWSLTSVAIPDSVTSIGQEAFDACVGLTEATIGNGVTYIPKYLFVSCNHLGQVTIGSGVTEIDGYAFWLCSDLTTVTILGNVTKIGAKAFVCPKLTAIYFHGDAPTVYPQSFMPTATLYYLPGAKGWGPTLDNCRTAQWKQ